MIPHCRLLSVPTEAFARPVVFLRGERVPELIVATEIAKLNC